MLRQEANKLQAHWESELVDWAKEKETLQSEITALRDSLSSVEGFYQEATDARNAEAELLKGHAEALRQKEDYYVKLASDKAQTDKQLRDLRDRDAKFQSERTTQILDEVRGQAKGAFEAQEAATKVNDQYVADLERKYAEKVQILTDREGVLTYENE